MRLRSDTIYACDAPLNGMPIMHLPEVMRTRPCPLCDHPRDPLSSDCFKTARQTWSFNYDAIEHWNYCKWHYLDPDYDGYCHEHVQQHCMRAGKNESSSMFSRNMPHMPQNGPSTIGKRPVPSWVSHGPFSPTIGMFRIG